MTPRMRRLLDRGCAQLWWVNAVAAPVLLPLLSGVVGLLFVYYALEWDSGKSLPSGWADLVPGSLANGVVIAAVGAGLGFLAFRAAREWPTTANTGALLGVLTTTVLAGLTRECDPPSGIVAGSAVVGVIIIGRATVAKVMAGEVGLTTERVVDETQSVTWNFSGLVFALQIAMLMFMGFLVAVAFTDDELPREVRPLLLVFAGVGITGAAAVKAELSLKNLMAFAGLVISVVGSYMQVYQVVDVGYVLMAVGVIVFIPFMIIGFHTHRAVPILTLPVVAALIVMSLVTLTTVLPAYFIGSGCGIGEESLLTAAGLIVIVALACGAATWCIVTVLLLVKKRQPPAPEAASGCPLGTPGEEDGA